MERAIQQGQLHTVRSSSCRTVYVHVPCQMLVKPQNIAAWKLCFMHLLMHMEAANPSEGLDI